ncbi:MAG: hypothetical protein DDT23_00038 [candidate division WS2 bacterium]|nr:hypothetical protein [Candidatus Lithacetigena glycinireducens]
MQEERKIMVRNNQAEAWEEILKLWKELAEMPDQAIENGDWIAFNNAILNKLGIGNRRHGSAFCERFYKTPFCPLGDCSDKVDKKPCWSTPFLEWEWEANEKGWHVKMLAQDFLDFLIYKKETDEKYGTIQEEDE